MAIRIQANYGKYLSDHSGKLQFIDEASPDTVWTLEHEDDYVRLRSPAGRFIAMNDAGEVKAIDRLNPNTRFVLTTVNATRTAIGSHTHKGRYVKATPDSGAAASKKKGAGKFPGEKGLFTVTQVEGAAKSAADSGPKSVTVLIENCENLRGANGDGTSDPYCRLVVGKTDAYEQQELSSEVQKNWTDQTQVKEKSLHPRFDETFTLGVRHVDFQAVVIDVMDKEKLGKDNFLGRVVIPLKDLKAGTNEMRVTLRFAGAQAGHAAMKLKITPKGFP